MSEKTTRLRLSQEHLRILKDADARKPHYAQEKTLSKRTLHVIEEYEALYNRVLNLENQLQKTEQTIKQAAAFRTQLLQFLENENGTV